MDYNIFRDLDKDFLIESLDKMQNAISIFNEDMRLMYCNDDYCRNMFIDSRENAVGKRIDDILNRYHIKIYSLEDNKEHLEMTKVMEYGKPIVDWEVKILKEDTDKSHILSFDMFPLLDEQGRTRGVIEMSHSRNQELKRATKMMGFKAEFTFDSIIGESDIMKSKKWQAAQYADSPFNLHIFGESGVGKELFAQSVHNASQHRKGPFVAINCASFPENLIESELFGYVGGAFTGANKGGQISKFELADGGTLFLDEIGEMQLPFQAKLLRVLETNTVTRIGGTTPIPFNVRIVSATNNDMAKMVEEGTFRRDLYYRLQVLSLDIPPLRDRGNDVLLIANHFLDQTAELYGTNRKELSPEAEQALLEYDWPGNIRELKNTINRLTILSKSGVIRAEDVVNAYNSNGYFLHKDVVLHKEQENKPELVYNSPEERIRAKMDGVDRAYQDLINAALDIAKGNKSEAAGLLGVSRKTLYNMMEKYNVNN